MSKELVVQTLRNDILVSLTTVFLENSCHLISSNNFSFSVSYPTENIFSCVNGSNSNSGICFFTYDYRLIYTFETNQTPKWGSLYT